MSTAAKMSSLSHATASTTFATTSRPEPHAESGSITDSNNVIEVERLFPRCLSSPNGGAAAVEPTSGCQFVNFVFASGLNFAKGTSINDVPRFLAIFDLPTYLVLL